MKTFLFYTTEGYTESPNNTSIENCQLLGEADGETVEEAFTNLIKENSWIEEYGFHTYKGFIIARELANTQRFYL
ncbi:hypothetical protein QVN97_06690 [Bacteroides caecigallinarum]|nr:hypothetical protein [Bacteroides caecigallinarum]